MKRQGVILNARQVKEGRRLLRQAAGRLTLATQARALLARGPAFAAKFAEAAKMAAPNRLVDGSDIALLVLAAYDGEHEANRIASELKEAARKRQIDRHPCEDWSYDAETEACYNLADAIRYIGSIG